MSDPWGDPDFHDHIITSVFQRPESGAWDFCIDGGFNDGLPAGHPIVPKVGDRVRIWWAVKGAYTMVGVRGTAINDQIVEYKTKAQYEADNRAWWLARIGSGISMTDDDCRRMAGVLPWPTS